MRVLVFASLLFLAAPARASLIGVSFEVTEGYPSVWQVDPVALTADPIGSSGLTRMNALAQRSDGALITIGQKDVYFPEYDAYFGLDFLAEIDPVTAQAQTLAQIAAYSFNGLAFSSRGSPGARRTSGRSIQRAALRLR